MSVKPAYYIMILVLAIAGSYIYKLRFDGIFACQAVDYGTSRYLADCNAGAYSDYDHGALWFGLEPDALRFASEADVLFLGSSQLQFGFSTPATVNWFSDVDASFYLLGFTHTENVNYVGPLLDKLEPKASAYVINVDRFFHNRETPPAREIFYGEDALVRYRKKQRWQNVHRRLCGTLPVICGENLAIFRSREDGYWVLNGTAGLEAAAVFDGPASNEELWDEFSAIGKQFVSRLDADRDCILLTLAPWAGTRRAEATALADSLGLRFIAPNPEGLMTYDGSHLDVTSRERWATAFFDDAEPYLKQCLESPG